MIILNAMRGAKKFDMVLSTFAALVYVIMEGVSMQIILHSLDFKKQGLKCVKYSFIGFFFNAITPSASGGQPMQVYYMHEEGINAGASSVTLLFWTIIYKVVLVVFELYVFLFHFDFAVKYIGRIYVAVYYWDGGKCCFDSFIYHHSFFRNGCKKACLYGNMAFT